MNSATSGTISGIVRFEGHAPRLAPIDVTKDKAICKEVPDESLIVGPTNGVQNSVITIEDPPKGAVPPSGDQVSTAYRLDNRGCRFVPHVLPMEVNQFLEIENSDSILHAAHVLFHEGQPQFNVGLYPGKIVRKPIVVTGIVKVICEVHPWMNAYIFVTDNPYHAVSDIYGRYEIRSVPPGMYRLKVWHERLGTQEQKIVVTAGKSTEANFTLMAGGASAGQ